MSSYWSSTYSTTSSTASDYATTRGYYYNRPKAGLWEILERGRPLSRLVEAERKLKEEAEIEKKMMPKEPIMFNPEDLVLGGETGWKKL